MCHAIENTVAAFEKAIEFGTYRIEFDVQRTRDGEIILMHDLTVDRTTNGSGAVAEMTLAQLRQLSMDGGATIPTLTEALHCLRGRCRALIELKQSDITEQVIEIIQQSGMVDDCTLVAFDVDCIRLARQVDPRIAKAFFFLKPGPFDAQSIIDEFGVDLVIVWPAAAVKEQIDDAKRCGLQVRCGYSDHMSYEESKEVFVRMVDMGVDEVSCGRPDWIARMIDEYAGEHK
jgi:glycerophosphoryl diester phosphodiesterase